MNKQTLQTNRDQAKRLTEMGLQLCELRQQQQISLEEIASKTRIQPRLLLAIEQGRLESLPESVYIQSFIRQYADAIGLDGVEFASQFPALYYKLPDLRPSWRSLPGAQLRPTHLYLLYLLLIVSAVNGLSYLLNRSTSQPEVANAELKMPMTPIGPVNPLQNVANAPLTQKQPGVQKAVRVGLMLTAQSWVRVVADGKTEFEGVLPEGTQRGWAANQQVVVRAGNAGGVLVSFNNGQSKKLGEPGEIEEVAFPPDPRLAVREMSAGLLEPIKPVR